MPRFTPLEFLGQGATGQVWKALDTTTNTHVALKSPAGDVPASDFTRFQQAYQTEAAILQPLQHPGVLRLAAIGLDEGRPTIAYEYLQGQTLRSLLSAGKTFSPAQTGTLTAGILDALEYLHGQGIVHRDLNPNNLMILAEQQGGVKILDFGAAAKMGTAAGPLIGTPQYMSPEQLQGGAPDPRSDLFAVAVVCYELLTGRPPFIGHSYPELVQQISGGQFPPARALKPELPDSVDVFLRTALAVDPARRYQTAGAMKAVMEQALAGSIEAPQSPSLAAISDDYARPTMLSGTPVKVDNAVLIAVEGPFAGRQFPLSGGITTLGGPYADIDLSRDLGIAAQHCWLIHEADRYLLHDADDSGGTILNGQAIRRAPLLEGDLITIGESVFRFQDPQQPLGANRPPGSVEYAAVVNGSPRQAAHERAVQTQIQAQTSGGRSGSDTAIWLILILLLFIIGGGMTIGTLSISSSVRSGMSLRLTPLWGRVEPVLSAGSTEEFYALAEKLDLEADRAFIASQVPQYPPSLGWLPGVAESVNEAEAMKSLLTSVYGFIEAAEKQPPETRSRFEATTAQEAISAQDAIRPLRFSMNPWPLYQNTATAKLGKLASLGVVRAAPDAATHPIVQVITPFKEGLDAFNTQDWNRAFTRLDDALVSADRWYTNATQEDLKTVLNEQLHPAENVARTLMAICEIRQAQIRVLHQPTDNLTPGDLDTIRGWVRDAESLLRRVKVEDLSRILTGLGFPADFDPRSLNDDIDAVKAKIDELKASPSTIPSGTF